MSFSTRDMQIPELVNQGLRDQIETFMNPAKSAERKTQDLSFVKLDQLETSMNELFTAISKDESLHQVPQVEEMLRARAAIDALEHDHTLSDDERKKQKLAFEESFSKSSSELFSKMHDDPRDPQVRPVAEFLARNENHAMMARVESSLNSALSSNNAHGPIPGMTREEMAEEHALNSATQKAGVADKLQTACKLSSDFLDSKNGTWDKEKRDWDNWKSYDQMSSEEKMTTALAAKKNGEAWKDLVESSKKDGVVPPEIQKAYDKELKNVASVGFGKEFVGEVQQHYPEATRSKRDHDGSTMRLAQNLIAGEHSLEHLDNGLAGAPAKPTGQGKAPTL